MATEDADWAEIRRLYCETTTSVRQIAEQHGITSQRLYARRVAENWPKRSAARIEKEKKPAHDGKARRNGSDCRNSTVSPRPSRREALLNRLYAAIDEKLKRLERRMKSGEASTVADSERETRELSYMIRSFEKVTEVASDLAQSAGQSPGQSLEQSSCLTAADAQRMRHAIAERLERLHRTRQREG